MAAWEISYWWLQKDPQKIEDNRDNYIAHHPFNVVLIEVPQKHDGENGYIYQCIVEVVFMEHQDKLYHEHYHHQQEG